MLYVTHHDTQQHASAESHWIQKAAKCSTCCLGQSASVGMWRLLSLISSLTPLKQVAVYTDVFHAVLLHLFQVCTREGSKNHERTAASYLWHRSLSVPRVAWQALQHKHIDVQAIDSLSSISRQRDTCYWFDLHPLCCKRDHRPVHTLYLGGMLFCLALRIFCPA